MSLSGHTDTDFFSAFGTGTAFNISELKAYQNVDSRVPFDQLVRALSGTHSVHAPLYWLVFWMLQDSFPDKLMLLRGISAVASIATIPGVFWLARTAFSTREKDGLTVAANELAALSVALWSLSPLGLVYTQEGREYALWMMFVVYSTVCLLKAQMTDRWQWWCAYAIGLTFSMYTQILTLIVATGHFVFLCFSANRRSSLRQFLFACLAAVICFSPWLFIIVRDFSQAHQGLDWTYKSVPLMVLISHWISDMCAPLVDLAQPVQFPWSLLYPFVRVVELVTVIAVVRQLGRNTSLILFAALSILSFAPLAIMDLVLGGTRSTTLRYMLPGIMAFQIMVCYCLHLGVGKRQTVICTASAVCVGLLVLCGWQSCFEFSKAPTWWNKCLRGHDMRLVASQMNTKGKPVLVACNNDFVNMAELLAVSHLLQPQCAFIYCIEPKTPDDFIGFSDIYFLNPSPQFCQSIAKRYGRQVQPVEDKQWFCVLERTP